MTKAYGALAATDALCADPQFRDVDASTVRGLRDMLAIALRAVSRLPFDIRTANALASLAHAQRSIIETADLAARIEALERAQELPPHG